MLVTVERFGKNHIVRFCLPNAGMTPPTLLEAALKPGELPMFLMGLWELGYRINYADGPVLTYRHPADN